MPFKSEAQRKYLWANEPEIARDWTDEYGSGIQAAQGGRIGLRRGSGPGPGGQGARGQATQNPGRSAPSGGGGGRDVMPVYTPPSPVTRGEHHPSISTGRERAIADITYDRPNQLPITRGGQHIGTGPLTQLYDKNLRNLQRQQQYRQGAYQRAHPFLSKVRSGLGSLGRGIGHVARNLNPLTFAFDNPLMKLLTSGYGQGNIRNLFQRNNQNINWNDPDEEEDVAWENVNYNPNALTRLQMEQGMMDPNILPEDRPTDSLMDERTLMAGLDDMSTYQIKDFKGLDMRDKMEKSGIEIPDPLSDEEKQRLEKLRNLRNSGMISAEGNPIV